MSKQKYYYHLNHATFLEKNAELAGLILKIFEKSHKTYGYRRITAELKNMGYQVNHKKVLKIMQLKEIKPICKKVKKYNSYKGEIGKVADNLIKRDFNSSLPLMKLATDVTEFKIAAGKLYLSPIIDMYNREIVAYEISYAPNLNMVVKMLEGLFALDANLDNTILHSDQGWQYQTPLFQSLLKENGIIQSMSRKGNCNDNGLMESFFSTIKQEMFNGREHTFRSLEDLEISIRKYIDFYNTERIKSRLNYMSPINYKKAMLHV